MKQKRRLELLEEKAAMSRQSRGNVGTQLVDRLWQIAYRLEHTQPDERWLRKASVISVAAMAMKENLHGLSSPLLWAKVRELARTEGPAKKLFENIMRRHGED